MTTSQKKPQSQTPAAQKARRARAKVQENAERVAKLNAASEPVAEPVDLFKQAMDRKRAGKRGKGAPIADADLVERLRAIRKVRPDAKASHELEIAYWIDGYALTRKRFLAAWEQAS